VPNCGGSSSKTRNRTDGAAARRRQISGVMSLGSRDAAGDGRYKNTLPLFGCLSASSDFVVGKLLRFVVWLLSVGSVAPV